MKINNLTTEEVFRLLLTSWHGISEKEAQRRLGEFGLNIIEDIKRQPLYIRFLKQFTHFLAVLLGIAAGLSFLSEIIHPGEGMLTLGIAIVCVIFINAIFTFIQEYRAERTIEKLKLMLPSRVKVVRDGIETEMTADGLVPGDLLLLSEGDKVSADARIVEANHLMVNNASLTGESEPVPLTDEPCEGELIESRNIAFAGTSIVSGYGKAVVFATGMRTEFGRIAHLTGSVSSGLSPLQREIINTTRIVASIATVMGVIFFIIGYLIGRGFWENFLFAVGIIVANVPEGLLPTVTLSLAMGSQRMAKRNALIKTLTSVEALGSVTVICTDKTGTLTQNRMEVRELWTLDRDESTMRRLKEIAYFCNNARFRDGLYSGDPTDSALLRFAMESMRGKSLKRLHEIPFDSNRKRMTTIHIADAHLLSFTKGALEMVLPLCSHVMMNGKDVLLDDVIKKKIIDASYSLMDRGLRVISFAYKEIEEIQDWAPDRLISEDGMVFVGLVGLEDPPRPEVPEAIKRCHDAGIRVIMVTGDAGRTAVAIAREIGLVSGNAEVIEGHEFMRMSDSEIRDELSKKDVIFARMEPRHKMRIVSILKDEGERVAVTGDGVNDAAALKKADIGIAMGVTGTDVAREASDMVLLDDNFATIVNAIEEGRAIYENIRRFISYIFSSNVPEIVPYLAYVLFRIPLPLTIMQILAVDLGTDMLPALALAAERPTEDLMKQPPRDPRERLLNWRLLSRAYLFLGPIEAVAGLFGFFYILKSGNWQLGDILSSDNPLYMQATTACLTAIIITQIANIFACRSFKESVFRIGFFSNKLIFIGIGFELAIQFFIVYHPFGNRIFHTSPISAEIWFILLPFAILLFVAEETRKHLLKVWQRIS